MHHTILFFLTLWSAFLVIITHGLLVTFPAQPVAGQDNIYVWSRNGTDPVDFFLQTAKVNDSDHRDESRISRSSPVVVPNVSEGGGQGLIRFNIAGIFQIIAVDTQDRNPENAFFYTFVTVQDSNSVPSGMPQDNNGSNSEDGGNRSDGGNHNQTMTSGNSKPPAGRSSWHRAIAGGVVGGCVFLALIAGGALLVFRRRRDVKRDMETSVYEPFTLQAPVNIQPAKGSSYLSPGVQDAIHSEVPQTVAESRAIETHDGENNIENQMREIQLHMNMLTREMRLHMAPPSYGHGSDNGDGRVEDPFN